MKVLIIGLGSIAQKHINALRKLEPSVELVALRTGESKPSLPGITNIYKLGAIKNDIDFAIISNPTSKHLETIKDLIPYKLPLFIEKPPLATLDGASEVVELMNRENIVTYTAFNFRFHPVLQWVKKNLDGKRVLEVQAYCGSYLPNWRPNVDYRDVYSAKKELGGGVHLDLIHELDYITWLFGKPLTNHGFTSKVSELEIDVPDVAHYWLSYDKMVASITLNYYRRETKRTLEIVFEDNTWNIDLIKNQIQDSSGEIIFKTQPNNLVTYEHQMEYFISCLKTGAKPMNSFTEALGTLEISLSTLN